MPSHNIGVSGTSAAAAEALRPVVVQAYADADASDWDAYVLADPHASFFHLSTWSKVVQEAFGYEPKSLIARRDGMVVGVLPLSLVSNWVTGKQLLSVPFGVYGGIAAADSAAFESLLQSAKISGIELGVQYLELRSRRCAAVPNLHRIDRYATFTTELAADDDANLKRLPRDTRYMIRKAEKAGLTAQHGLDLLGVFYKLFAQNMQNHGTPVFPKSYFDLLAANFGKQMDLMLVYHGSKPVAGVLSFLFRDAVLPYYAGVSAEARAVAANNFMYWELMKWATERGIRWFDFGRSKKGTGAYAFKSQWNMQVEELEYQVFLVRRKSVPNFSPTNPKFELATRVWQKLPLSLTTFVGPKVSRWFP